jgi:formylglycine-generating enzyme required for sulfatase activity
LLLQLGGGVTLECVRIRAGTFLMGSADGDGDEKPPHRVTISKPYYLGKFAVTVGQFRRFVEATGYRTEAEADGRGGYGLTAGDRCVQNPVFTWRCTGFPQTVDHPVVNVSWNDAVAFCDWLSNKTEKPVRLPTEAEWEYGCRTPTPDQATFNASVWYLGNTNGKGTRPCGQKLPNAWGLYDTLGNVSEWCRDGKRTYASRDDTDPVGPMVGGCARVFRGGSFTNAARHCRTARRNSSVPSGRFAFLGFRVSLSW